jgi:hypothetical protein
VTEPVSRRVVFLLFPKVHLRWALNVLPTSQETPLLFANTTRYFLMGLAKSSASSAVDSRPRMQGEVLGQTTKDSHTKFAGAQDQDLSVVS